MLVLVVIARYQARPGKGAEVESILGRHAAQTRAEPGCLCFEANRAEEDGDQFVLYEQYADEAALRAHRHSQHFRDNVERGIVPLLAERAWQRYRLIAPA
jgi:quinol monooxygenase YgiN